MIVDFDLLVDFVVAAHEFADGVLFEHAHYVAFGIEAWGVYVHGRL